MTKKKRTRYTPEQILKKLRDVDAMLNVGKELAAVLLVKKNKRFQVPKRKLTQ